MDFFEHQDRSRRRSRWLVLLFAIAVVVITVGVTLVIALLAHAFGPGRGAISVPDGQWLAVNRDLLTICAAVTIAFIGLASWYRLVQLRGGGGRVAESLGGVQVLPDDSDPDRRRLYNVVEEMSIASGLPVPSVYVMERESGINAFAAGLTPSDAAIAVTRGALMHLTRDELQGVVGHEFSHILHGDMTLNVRLMGQLFGILAVSMVGRAMLRTGRRRSFSSRSSRSRGGGIVVLAGLALYLLGYIGVFVGRIIQAAVCRQREFLADASAVQFTRQADGLADALRKIAGLSSRSYMRSARAEEVSHMLFGSGRRAHFGLFATHPPIEERLQALQPHRTDYEIAVTAATDRSREPGFAASPVAGQESGGPPASPLVDASAIADAVGNPGEPQFRFAEHLAQMIPIVVWQAAHRVDGGVPILLALLLHEDPAVRDRQVGVIEARFGNIVSRSSARLADELSDMGPTLRLPLLDLALPTFRGLTRHRREFLMDTVETLVEMDGRVDAFEAAVASAVRTWIRDLDGHRPGRPDPKTVRDAVRTLLAGLAHAGHADAAQRQSAYRAGIKAAGALADNAPRTLDEPPRPKQAQQALETLDALAPPAKRLVVAAMAEAAATDGKLAEREMELIRAACRALHCPIPPLAGMPAT
jgi:Zn-dependent protease with chaperone function